MQCVALPEELKESILTYACTLPPACTDTAPESLHIHDARIADVLGGASADRPDASSVLFPAPARVPKRDPRCTLDVPTTLCVMLLSRHYYALGAQLLYRAPVLAYPSQLEQFARSLAARPVLGRLVRHLYVGTTERRTELPLPLFQGRLASYEQGLLLTPEYPAGPAEHTHPCEPHGSLLPHVIERDMGEISALYLGAPDAHGFDVFRPGFDREQEWIGVGAWVLRVQEARCLLRWLRALAYQERLESALQNHTSRDDALRQLREESEDVRTHLAEFLHEYTDGDHRSLIERRTGTRHDPLDWGDAPSEPTPLPEGLPVDEYEILLALQWRVLDAWPRAWRDAIPAWLGAVLAQAVAYGRYLALTASDARRDAIVRDEFRHEPCLYDARRQGASFFAAQDRFNDPCLYARSGVIHFLVGDEFAVPGHAAPPEHADFWSQPARSPDGDLLMPTTDQLVVGSFAPRPLGLLPNLLHIPSGAEVALPTPAEYAPTPTLGSLIATVHSVLSLSPNLESLGLSGVLERAVAGERTTAQLPRLDRIYLGPPPSFWAHPLLFGASDHPVFAHVRHVSITGCLLFQDEAASLAGSLGALPHLESVNWSMFHSTWEEGAPSVIRAIATMLELPASYPSQASASTPHGRRGVQHLNVVLHPIDFEAVRAHAPAGLLENPRLRLEAARRDYTEQHHTIFVEWADSAQR